MTPRFNILLSLLALLCTLISGISHAQIPRTINYQGYLTTASGVAVTGDVQMTLKIYLTDSAQLPIRSETHASVVVTNGVFNVRIGSDAASPLGTSFLSPYFLGVTVGTDPEMMPRRPLSSAPYAVTAENIASGGNIFLSNSATGSSGPIGMIFKNGNRFMHNTGSLNTFLGNEAGNFNLTAGSSTGIGHLALNDLTGGPSNTAVGFNAALSTRTGEGNTAVGASALAANTLGSFNVAVGLNALTFSTANDNIGIGTDAGFNLTTGGNNIMIRNAGVAGESETIRLGNSSHTRTFLSGNVGFQLGTGATPDRPVTIQASGVEWFGLRDSAGANKWHVNHKNGGVNFAETGVVDGRLFLAAGGNVVIGTDVPTKAKLEINGTAASNPGGGQIYSSGGSSVVPAGLVNLSMYASSAVAASFFLAFSDQRIKRITGRSNTERDLATLAAIEITDYTHIDTAQRGDKSHKKVIAQQVEKVFPQAVNKITDVVPDIYQRAAVKDGWIALSTNLKKGDRVRLIGNATQGEHEVLEVTAGRFRTAFKADADTVFVYGREVKDFRTVDYEAIAMLNVSATQELHRRAAAQDARLTAQAAEIAALKTQLAQLGDLQEKVAALMAQAGVKVASK